MSHVMQSFDEEARVQQVQNGMLDSSHVPGHFCNGPISRCPVKRTRIDHGSQSLFCLYPCCGITRLLILWTVDLADWNAELASKLEVALVMSRNAHDCT